MAKVILRPVKDRPTVYAFNAATNADEVKSLILELIKKMKIENSRELKTIYVLSGVHGDTEGNLTGEADFYKEDKELECQGVHAVKVSEKLATNTWNKYFGQSKSILILAWCYSERWKGLDTYYYQK